MSKIQIIVNNIFVIYVVIINIYGFVIWGIDKILAINHKFRISERNLLYICILGGRVGGLFGSILFEHKSSKISFGKKMYIISLIQIIVIIIYIIYS